MCTDSFDSVMDDNKLLTLVRKKNCMLFLLDALCKILRKQI